jgi:hypothetical protein
MSETKEAVQDTAEMNEEQIKQREEDLKKQKKELTAFYKDELPLLKLQADYEETISRIEAAKFERLQIMYARAQMMAPPPSEEEGGSEEPAKERTLKKEE